MFTTFHALRYKGLQLEELCLGRLNLFVGPNNCGKSNLFSAMSLVWELEDAGLNARMGSALMEKRVPIQSAGHNGPAHIHFRVNDPSSERDLFIEWPGSWTISGLPGEKHPLPNSLSVHHASLVPREIARPQSETEVDRLDEQGLHLVNLLAGYLKHEGHPARLTAELQPLIPGLTNVRVFSGGGYRWIQLQIHEQWKNLAELSDGTVSLLLLATLLFAPVPLGVLCLDEPELNLHPAWARVVAGWLARQTAWSQVHVATHSPELMDPLTALYAQGEVRLFVFQLRGEGFVLEPRAPEQLATLLDEGYLLGDLYRIGEPALGGWPW
jgi:hypothetical protein